MNKTQDTQKSQDLITPSFFRRFLAIIYDSLLLIPVLMFAGGAILGIQAALNTLSFYDDITLNSNVLMRQISFLLTVFCFFSWFWIKNGQTLGMQSWRIKLISINGEVITIKHTVLRFAGAILSTSIFGLGYFWILFDEQDRAWHDIISKTRLILIPK